MRNLTAITVVFLFFCSLEAGAQNFTKITNSIVSNDGGDSRAVTWIDYDDDGDLDLFVTNGPSAGQNNFLYRNNGDGTFTKITDQPVVNDNGKSDGCSWGDFNNDGSPDLCVVNWYNQNNFLYQNTGEGNFTFLNASIISNDAGYSETCSWGDYNNDGLIDLYVTNSGTPFRNYLYHNAGSGEFVKIDTGIAVAEAFHSRGANWVDYDNDNDQDLFVCNEENEKNNLYENMGNGYFIKITEGDIVNDIANSWSASWGDIDNDGDLDVFIANWNQQAFLYLNNGDKTFVRVTSDPVVESVEYSAVSSWGDYDNDGDLDLFVTTFYGASLLKNLLYKNLFIETGYLFFAKITSGDIVNDLGWTYGNSWGDYDNDGDLDMFIARTNSAGSNNNVLYRNDESPGNSWIGINCRGVTSNRSGIGALVRVKTTINGKPVWQMRTVNGQDGYCSQNLQLHFGLGNGTVIDSLIISWPSGMTDRYANVSMNKLYEAVEGESITVGINTPGAEIPERFALHQNFPNPFNPVTRVKFDIPSKGAKQNVKLAVYNSAGREAAVLVNSRLDAGSYEYIFDGAGLTSGVYFYTLQAGGFVQTKKMILLR